LFNLSVFRVENDCSLKKDRNGCKQEPSGATPSTPQTTATITTNTTNTANTTLTTTTSPQSQHTSLALQIVSTEPAKERTSIDLTAITEEFKEYLESNTTIPELEIEPEINATPVSITEKKEPFVPTPVAEPATVPEVKVVEKPVPVQEPVNPPDPAPTSSGSNGGELEFPPPPPKPAWKQGGTQAEYKQFMINRYKYEQWENAKILHRRKMEEGNTEAAQNIIKRLQAELNA